MWPIVLLAVSSNLDDLGVGFALGMKRRTLGWWPMAVIAALSGVTMGFGLLAGAQVGEFLPGRWPAYLSASIFATIGGWFFYQGIQELREPSPATEPATSDPTARAAPDSTPTDDPAIGLMASLGLGLALGVDSIALGFSGGLAGYPVLATAALATGTSLVFLWSGSRIGARLAGLFGRYGTWVAGGLLFLLAMKELL